MGILICVLLQLYLCPPAASLRRAQPQSAVLEATGPQPEAAVTYQRSGRPR